MSKKRMKISDIWNVTNIGNVDNVFTELSDDTNYPLLSPFIVSTNVQELVIEYFIGFSADKYLSPLLQKMVNTFIDADDPIDYDVISIQLAKIIYNRFATKWMKIYDALMTSYKPLENYSMEETRTPDLTSRQAGSNDTESDGNTGVYGFNSNSSKPNTTAHGEQHNTIDITTTESGTEKLERAGNIGVTTSQQMLQSEIDLRQYDFYKQIYKDIDEILCLSIY